MRTWVQVAKGTSSGWVIGGTVTGARIGSAVVAGLLVATLAIGGPGVVVVAADPGSHSSHSRDGRDNRGAHRDRDGSSDRRESRQDRGADSRRDTRTGTREDRRGASTERAARDTGAKGSASKNSRDDDAVVLVPAARGGQSTARVAPDQPVVTVPEPQPAPESGGGGGGSVGAVVTSADPPRVVFGNGRTPGPPADASDTRPPVTTPAVVVSADVPAPAAWTPPPAQPAAPTMIQRTMAPLLTPTAPASGLSSLWGLAGLILAPLAGILLGYRQARANKAAADLKSSLTT